jgi:hypothetical protein
MVNLSGQQVTPCFLSITKEKVWKVSEIELTDQKATKQGLVELLK